MYLAGNIQKGHEKESALYWTEEDREAIARGIDPIEVAFLNPAIRTDDLSDQKSVFGRDMTQVYCSDFIFVDARERRGLGVGAEMMWAKMNRIPVLTLAGKNTHYRKEEVLLLGVKVEDWVHPFVESLSDAIVEDLSEGISWMQDFLAGNIEIKGPEFIHDAMKHYQKEQLPHDLPMQELVEKGLILQ